MKKVLSLIIVSALGGAITLGSYLLFFDKTDTHKVEISNDSIKGFQRASYITTAMPAENMDFTKIAESSVNAVVHVKNLSIIQPNPLAEFFYGYTPERGTRIVGTGSGVIISPDGYIITNNHVIKGAKKIEVTLNDKSSYEADIVGFDESTDIALLKIDGGSLPSLPFGDSDNLKVGEWVLAVGNPYNLTSTVTAGIVSAKARNIHISNNSNKIESFIQTDAAVNPGNSGGALVNVRGELIGINTAISSQTGSYVGYSFAVPSNISKKVIEDILEFGNVQRAYLGINVDDLDSKKAEHYGVATSKGVIITRVIDQGAAQEAGFVENDVIIKMDNVNIEKFSDLQGYLGSKRPGDQIKVIILRDNEEKELFVKLKNQFGKLNYGKSDFTKYYFGELMPIPSKEVKKLGIDYGVKIIDLTNNKLIRKYGVRNGDYILAIEDQKVKTVEDIEEMLKVSQNKDYINVLILKKNGDYGYIRLE